MYLHIHDLKVGTLSLFLSEVDISLSFSVENYENISRQPCIGLRGKLDLLISIKERDISIFSETAQLKWLMSEKEKY